MATLTPAANDASVKDRDAAKARLLEGLKRLAAALDKALSSSADGARGF